jgi:3-oxoacyl-[acyl-carrier protein] reductase
MDLELKDKVVAVAASSQGLGKAVAVQLAREGAKLGMCSRKLDSVQVAAAEIQTESNVDVLAMEADLSTLDDAGHFVDETAAHFGGLDALVCNAGGPPAGTFENFDDAAWESAFQLTLMSVVRLCRAALPHFIQRGGGRIVIIGSVSTSQPIDNLILSNSIRMAVLGLAKSLSNEYGPYNITVNCIGPGFTQTERLDQLFKHRAELTNSTPEEVLHQTAQSVPMQRVGQPNELADLATLLCSSRAGYVTGVSIPVDGGATKGY